MKKKQNHGQLRKEEVTYELRDCAKGCGRMISSRPTAWLNHASGCSGPKIDRRRGNKGAGKRVTYTYAFKWRALRTLEQLTALSIAQQQTVTLHPRKDTAVFYNINQSLITRWYKDRTVIIREAKSERTKRKTKAGSPRYMFADIDQLVSSQLAASCVT